jgi:hypothetical protein
MASEGAGRDREIANGWGSWNVSDNCNHPSINTLEYSLTAIQRFRWVVCQLDELQKRLKPNDLRKQLKSMPETSDDTYSRILDNIDQRYLQDTLKILQWRAYSAQPLQIEEVAEVIALDIDGDPRSLSSYSKRGTTSTCRDESTATRYTRHHVRATTRSCSCCSKKWPTSTSRETLRQCAICGFIWGLKDTSATRCRRLHLGTTTGSSSCCSRSGADVNIQRGEYSSAL